jgi:hypothetical protein
MSPGRPRATPIDAAIAEGVLLEALWRVGTNRTLSLLVTGVDSSSQVAVRVRTPEGSEIRMAAAITAQPSEWTLRAEASAGSPAFTLACVDRAGGAPLIITDLPARLGLAGGTYELDRVVA